MRVLVVVMAVLAALVAGAPGVDAGVSICDELDFPHDSSRWIAIGNLSTRGQQVWFSEDNVYVIQSDTMVNCKMTLVKTIAYDSRFKPLNRCVTVANVGTTGGLPQIVVVPEAEPTTVYQVQLIEDGPWQVIASVDLGVPSSTHFEKLAPAGINYGVIGVLVISTDYMVSVLLQPFQVQTVWHMHADIPPMVPVSRVVSGGYFGAESIDFGFAVLGGSSDRDPAQVVLVHVDESVHIQTETAVVSYDDPTPRALSPTDPNMGLQGTDIVWAQQWKSGHGSIFLWNIDTNQYDVVTVPLHSGDEFSNAVVAAKMFIDRIVFFSGTSSHFSAFSMDFQGSLSLASSSYFRGYGVPTVAANVGMQTGTGNACLGGRKSGHLYALLMENLVSMDDTMQLNDDEATVREDLRDAPITGCVAGAGQCPASLFVTSASCMPQCTCGPPTAPVCGPTLACGGGNQCCEDRSRRIFDCCGYNPY